MEINAKRRQKYRRNTKEKLALIFSKDTGNVLPKLRTGNASAELGLKKNIQKFH